MVSRLKEPSIQDLELKAAAERGDIQTAKVLLENGANPNMVRSGEHSPLILAVDGGYIELIKLLLSHGSDVNYQNELGESALELAVIAGSEAMVELLIRAGADVNKKSTFGGTTPLQCAHQFGYPDIATLLERMGAKE